KRLNVSLDRVLSQHEAAALLCVKKDQVSCINLVAPDVAANRMPCWFAGSRLRITATTPANRRQGGDLFQHVPGGIPRRTGQRQRRRFGSTSCAVADNQSGRINHRAPSHPGCRTREGVTPSTTTYSIRPCRLTSSSALMMQSIWHGDFKLKRITFANGVAHCATIWPPPAAIVMSPAARSRRCRVRRRR
ncbi:MAG: hypothetical protein QOC88_3507, partial [Mycobacterium sp.]|nr:hypothetical protein [Mycobacterium sp.]